MVEQRGFGIWEGRRSLCMMRNSRRLYRYSWKANHRRETHPAVSQDLREPPLRRGSHASPTTAAAAATTTTRPNHQCRPTHPSLSLHHHLNIPLDNRPLRPTPALSLYTRLPARRSTAVVRCCSHKAAHGSGRAASAQVLRHVRVLGPGAVWEVWGTGLWVGVSGCA